MVTGTQVRGRISPTQDLVAGEELRPRHIRARGWTCPAKVSGIQSKLRICLVPLGFWFVGMIQEFILHHLTQCIPLHGTELVGLK
jgi:hypothetical protein